MNTEALIALTIAGRIHTYKVPFCVFRVSDLISSFINSNSFFNVTNQILSHSQFGFHGF